MHATAARFGAHIQVLGVADDEVVVRLANQQIQIAFEDGEVWLSPSAGPPPVRPVTESPFSMTEFGSTRRLAWPGGGRPVASRAQVLYVHNRYALLLEPFALTVVDADDARQLALKLPKPDAPDAFVFGAAALTTRHLVVAGADSLTWFALDEILALDPATRQRELVIANRFPLRRPEATAHARVLWLFDHHALVAYEQKRWRLDRERYGLHESGQELVLRDELWPGTFATLEVPGRPPAVLHAVPPEQRVACRLSLTNPRDPASTGAVLVAPEDTATAGLLDEVLRAPDDDAPRHVLADALQQRGDPLGEFIALSLSADPDAAARRESLRRRHQRMWLGALAHFVEDVVYARGLPSAATLVRRPPADADLLAQAVDDPRLGTFERLLRANGPVAVYRALVGSPRAVSLRRITANETTIVRAVIDSGRTSTTHLDDARLARDAIVKLLAHPAFDAAAHLETSVHAAHFQGLLDRIATDAHGFFARTPRHLIIHERFVSPEDLAAAAIKRWPQLKLASLTVGDVRLTRNGGTVLRLEALSAYGGFLGFPRIVPGLEWLLRSITDLVAIELTGAPLQTSQRALLDRMLPGVPILAP